MVRRCLNRQCRRKILQGTYCKPCNPYRQPGWSGLSAGILRRDNWTCHLCGQPGADTADHLIPVAQGGTDEPANLAAAHRSCNASKRGSM